MKSCLAAVAALAVALGVYAADMREMTMRIPLMSKAPVVDGIVEPTGTDPAKPM